LFGTLAALFEPLGPALGPLLAAFGPLQRALLNAIEHGLELDVVNDSVAVLISLLEDPLAVRTGLRLHRRLLFRRRGALALRRGLREGRPAYKGRNGKAGEGRQRCLVQACHGCLPHV
jgi:hypothetical protein